ncbi:hypothetical protein ABZU53_29055 [Micromonospora sp. NPDC005194]|uniref:hypothetical protein n=1 Tax=Micromonospora sp. NPDC005194 TaxID=3156870 RepID=UPI0033A8AB2D
MSELDRLRHAMRATERPDATLDLATVMRAGRRLRIRRRVAGGAAATVVAGLVAVTVVAVGGPGPTGPAPTGPAPPVAVAPPSAAATASAAASASASGEPTPPQTVAPGVPGPKPLGKLIDTGVRHGADWRVYYVVAVSVPGEPKVTIGLAAGRRAPDGTLSTDILVNDVEGADRSPGFHQIGYDERSSAVPVPTFGYFVGPAERIIGTVAGRQVDARVARWSIDKQVVIFWFDPATLTPGERLDGIVARDRGGRRL